MDTRMPPRLISDADLSISAEESFAFAALSGDYNPLHVDPIAARRTPFGTTVVHGIHIFLRAVDELVRTGLIDRGEPGALSATFHHPVPTGSSFDVRASAESGKIRFTANLTGTSALTGAIEISPAPAHLTAVNDSDFAPMQSHRVDFPPLIGTGTVPLKLSRTRLATLFPSLASLSSLAWIADMLATTQIVGMVCPGMDSIYSGFKLRRGARPSSLASSMAYQIDSVGQRSRMVRLRITGSVLAGTVEAFFRPRPVGQRSMKDIAPSVPHGAFTGHRVLVVGGSRGLGEVTAKIVAAGGAEVVLTYSRGKEDGENVCAEVRALGGACVAYPLGLPMTDASPEWLTRSHFSHVYFFASPPIPKSLSGWNEVLFNQYANVYLNSFAMLVERVLAAGSPGDVPARFFYPSSIFVTHPEAGFAEYASAKAAGEALCDQLQGRSAARFSKPRLPRMRTDQTSGLAEENAVDPFPVMLEAIRAFHSP